MDTELLRAAGTSKEGPSISPNDPRLARCGFAKLQGEGIEFFIRKYEITIGRTSKNSTLDLILGDSTTISRQHASIRYNFDSKCFELVVLGKNGVTVESSGATHLYTPDSPPTPLRSRDLLVVGEKRFYLLLPRDMGGQSRKRRRVESSPAPGPLPQPAAAAVPGPVHPPQHPPRAFTSGPMSKPQQLQQLPPAAGGSGSAFGSAAAGAEPAAPTLHHTPRLHPSPQKQQAAYTDMQVQRDTVSTAMGPAVQQPHQPESQRQQGQQTHHMHHDDDDALIDSNALPYDNGQPFGYGDASNGFARDF